MYSVSVSNSRRKLHAMYLEHIRANSEPFIHCEGYTYR